MISAGFWGIEGSARGFGFRVREAAWEGNANDGMGDWEPESFFSERALYLSIYLHPVRLDLSAESAAIQQCFSLTTNQ
jgi:hypothetical protein